MVARGFDGSEDGASGAARGFPHAAQNRAPADTVALQRGHLASSEVPHCSQNRAAEWLSNLQDGHVIALWSPCQKLSPQVSKS